MAPICSRNVCYAPFFVVSVTFLTSNTRLAKWKRDALHRYRDTTLFYESLIQDVKDRLVRTRIQMYGCTYLEHTDKQVTLVQNSGTSRPCLTAKLIEERERFGVSDVEVAHSAGTM